MEARASDLRKMRKHLSVPGLLAVVRANFERIKEPGRSCRHTLMDNLMCGLALFTFKYPSMLQFDEQHRGAAADPVLQHNLARLYGVATVPSDSSLHRRLDRVSPLALQRVFGRVFEVARRHKALMGFQALGGHYLLAVDGTTGQFASERVHCDTCCVKRHRDGRMTYYHQLLAAVLVHPSQSVIVPLAPEPILKSDGVTRNDCEQRAASRLLPAVRRAHPHLKMVVLQDALAATGPYLQQCRELDMRYLIAVQPGSHAYLFDEIGVGAAGEWFADDSEAGQACGRQLRLVSDVPLNHTHRDTVRVTVLQARETPLKGRTAGRTRTWVTDLPLTRATADGGARLCTQSLEDRERDL